MSLRAACLNLWLRWIEKTALRRAINPQTMRQRLERNARIFFHPPRGTQMQWLDLDHAGRRVSALDVVPEALNRDLVLFYIHGGGFVFGSPRTHAALAANLGQRLKARAVLPRYRLAPEAPFPAAGDDVRCAWDALCASGTSAQNIVVGGDSAGGALALSLLASLVAEKAPLPAATFCFSPLTDLTFSGASFEENALSDAVLPAERTDELTQAYLQSQPADDPRVSPLFANFQGASPVWITAGDREILRDDARRMATKMQNCGVDVTYEEKRNLPHVWPIFHNILPEAQQSLDDLAGWISRQMAPPSES